MTKQLSKFIAFTTLLLTGGCLWICRIPFPHDEKYSDDGVCTNRVWRAPINDMCGQSWTNWTVYPLIGLRVYASQHLTDEDDIPLEELKTRFPERYLSNRDIHNIKWQRRFRWAQYGIIWIGSPIDACVDTVLLPFDLILK